MMMNLFSSDPSTKFFNLSLNWMSALIPLLMIPLSFCLLPSRFIFLWKSVIFTLHKEFKLLLGHSSFQWTTLIFISLFSTILFINFMMLFPYIFTSSSHLSFTLTFALPLWLSFMIFGWINNTKYMFAHLVPLSTPGVLMPFMVLIETISNLICPGTLAVRLTGNYNTSSSVSTMILILMIMVQILLLMLETAVAIIQSYVFSILSTLYSSEVI